MKRLFKNIICAVLAPVALVSCMDLDENVYDKLPTDEFGALRRHRDWWNRSLPAG